jgi:pyridoxine 4-dehydrogenase
VTREIVPIAAVQNHYNLSERRSEDVVDYCAREEIAFVPFFPLRGEGGRALAEIAKRHGATSTQIALAWLLGVRRRCCRFPAPSHLRT